MADLQNYNSSYTGPQIDAAVGAVIDKENGWDEAAAGKLPAGGEAGQVLEKTSAEDYAAAWRTSPFLVRPNLLDNWCFVGGGSQDGADKFPVNQRRQPSYSGTGYYFDRWRMNGTSSGNCITTITSDGITINNADASSNNWLNQPFETPLPAGTYTLSILTTAVSDSARIELLNGATPVGGYSPVSVGLSIHRVTIQNHESSANKFAIWVRAGSSVSVVAAKLELGNEQTLAHQENGVWVLNELPDFGEELLSCQRYFQTFRTQTLRPTFGADFRPVMATDEPALDSFVEGNITYFTASAEP